jgi:hypothetical protein
MEYVLNVFDNLLNNFYQSEKVFFQSLIQMNKKFIVHLITVLNTEYNKQTKGMDVIENNVLREDIEKKRQIEFQSELEKHKNDFESSFEKPVIPIPTFSDPKPDPNNIQSLDILEKRILEEREQDLLYSGIEQKRVLIQIKEHVDDEKDVIVLPSRHSTSSIQTTSSILKNDSHLHPYGKPNTNKVKWGENKTREIPIRTKERKTYPFLPEEENENENQLIELKEKVDFLSKSLEMHMEKIHQSMNQIFSLLQK